MNNLPRLSNRDLAILAKDRNVPEAIARAARRNIDQRQPKHTPFRKH